MATVAAKKENIWLNLLLNVVVPSFILMKFSNHESLGEVWGLLLALIFPLAYGVYDMVQRDKLNVFSIIGLVSVLLTGGIGLLHLGADVLAFKEAGIPFLLGLIVMGSHFTRYPLLKVLFREALNMNIIEEKAQKMNKETTLDHIYLVTTLLFASSFFLSSVLNFLLAHWIVVSPAESEVFYEELGRMTMLSYPVIVVPVMIVTFGAVGYMLYRLHKEFNVHIEDLVKG